MGKKKTKKLYPKSDGSIAVAVNGKFAGTLPNSQAKGTGNKESLELGADGLTQAERDEINDMVSEAQAAFERYGRPEEIDIEDVWKEFVLLPKRALEPDALAQALKESTGVEIGEDDAEVLSAVLQSENIQDSQTRRHLSQAHLENIETWSAEQTAAIREFHLQKDRERDAFFASQEYADAVARIEKEVVTPLTEMTDEEWQMRETRLYRSDIPLDSAFNYSAAYNAGLEAATLDFNEYYPAETNEYVFAYIEPALWVYSEEIETSGHHGRCVIQPERDEKPRSPEVQPILSWNKTASPAAARKHLFITGAKDALREMRALAKYGPVTPTNNRSEHSPAGSEPLPYLG